MATNRLNSAMHDQRLAQVIAGYLLATEAGQVPGRQELMSLHPDLAADLDEFFADQDQFGRLVEPLKVRLPAVQAMHLSAAGYPRSTASEFEPERPLGDFRIVREIGRGGMGIVYEAVQISLGRRVALKVLPFAAALDARQLQRFKNEAQAAAHLHHQNIVPVYAVGCERGVHLYAMQYIEGQTLAALIQDLRRLAGLETEGQGGPWEPVSEGASALVSGRCVPAPPEAETFRPPAAAVATEHSTSKPSILRMVAGLAVQAAEALEHAHGLGVVHRDIKPANLLVDVRGNLWVTDFGLAQVQTDTRLTLTGDLIGTLRYMSPEQALAHPIGVSHRTDIYSLGATLYELLTLEPAFNGCDRQELLRQIAFEEPKPPRRINHAIPADLETIVLKALAKNPAERYATAQELADDLHRFLEDKPIRARRPSWLEQTRKWGRRHRPVLWSAAVASFVALLVLAGSAGWVARDHAARQARIAIEVQTALEESLQFQKEAKFSQAEATAKRAEALLASSGGSEELQQRVHEVLADLRMVAKLEEVRLLRSGVRDGHFDSVGAVHGYAAAFRDYGIDVEALDSAEAAGRIGARTIRVELAAALDGWAETRQWFPQKGLKSWQELLAVARAADQNPSRAVLRDELLRGDGQALVERAASDEVHILPPATLVLLAECLTRKGNLQEATALLRRAQEQHPGDFWINHTLADCLFDRGTSQWDEAITFYTAAVALRPDSPGARLNLGFVLWKKGRLDEARATFRKTIELKGDYVEAHCNLGSVLCQQGRFDEAIAVARKAISLKPDNAQSHCNLGFILWKKGRHNEAIDASGKAIELKPDLLVAHFNLGLALADQGCFDEAIDAFRRVILLKADYAEAHCNLGNALSKKDQPNEAIAAYDKALKLKPDLFQAHFNRGRNLEKTGRLDEAVAAYGRVLDLKPDFAPAHYDLGNIFRDQKKPVEAEAAYRRAIDLKPDYPEAWCNLGVALRQQGEFDEALAALMQGHELGSKRPDWPYASAQWIEDYQRLGELQGRLPAVLRGEAQPADAAEYIGYALLCYDQRRFVASARLRANALTADPKLADDLGRGYRFDSACAAALAGCGEGADTDQIDDKERVGWRKQALQLLRDHLEAHRELLASGDPTDHRLVRHRLRGWQEQQDLAGLRNPDAVARLPAEEQQMCKQLWADIQSLLTKADSAE